MQLLTILGSTNQFEYKEFFMSLFLFAGDQKIEHLHKDFYGPGIPAECVDPEHLFKIASQAPIDAFATQLGLIEQYGNDYKNIPYVVKLNSKTDLVPVTQADPLSLSLHTVADVMEIKEDMGLSIVGVGYTVYLGSEYEAQMLSEAAQVVFEAHRNGLKAILWMYPRGKAIKDERDPMLIAGAAGVGAALGADFVKVNPPKKVTELSIAIGAAGRTGVICSGGTKKDDDTFLHDLEEQANLGVAGCAVGRNIHQRTVADAIAFCEKIHAIIK